MFTHVALGSSDIERSRRFYDALFAIAGGPVGMLDERGRLFYVGDDAMLILDRPIDGKAASAGNGSTIGFRLGGPEQVIAWHEAGIRAGGTSVEDPPGMRTGTTGSFDVAYLRDPDGNKICGVYRHSVSRPVSSGN